jgi:hypothetical protein
MFRAFELPTVLTRYFLPLDVELSDTALHIGGTIIGVDRATVIDAGHRVELRTEAGLQVIDGETFVRVVNARSLDAGSEGTWMNVEHAGTELGSFDARELSNVLDRVVTPITLDINGEHFSIRSAYSHSWGTHAVLTDDTEMSIDNALMVELIGPVDVLDADDGVLAYVTRDGEMLCADHGARWDIGLSDGFVSPVFDASHLDAVEYCSHVWHAGDRGHSFCGTCGTHTEPKGHPDSGFVGDIFQCDHCSEKAVFIDGEGYVHVEGFEDVTEGYNVEVKGSAVHRALSSTGLTITAVTDATPYRFTATRGFVCFLDDNPSAGRLLVLGSSWDDANEEAEEHFDGTLQRVVADVIELEKLDVDTAEGMQAVEDVEADFRASLQVVRVDLDAVTFHPKR